MSDPLHLAAALDFLADSPAPVTTLTPATPERRRFMLEDTGAALAYFAASGWAAPGPAQRAAVEVFELAACVWRDYLLTFAGSFEPDTATLNLHAWASGWALSSTGALPEPLYVLLADSFPQVGAWAAMVHVCGALPLPDAGTAAAWWAVCELAAMCAGAGFEDGEPEDLLNAVLSSLEAGAGRAKN